jgi:hypothetical protein
VITNLLHDDTKLILENTAAVMKRAETYLECETASSDNHTTVLKDDTSDSKEILAFKAELAELKAVQATVMTMQGQGAGRRIHNKRHHDFGARTADKAGVDVCKTCSNRHPGRPCWKKGYKKREEGIALLQETEIILATRKSNNKPSDLEIKHITDQDVGDSKWLESLGRCVLFDQQFMPDTEA